MKILDSSDFESMCHHHDLTYMYSDDGGVWRLGEESFEKIRTIAKTMDREEVKKIWNKIVDEKINTPYQTPFYWKDSWFDY